MSVHVSSWVWKQTLPAAQKLIMLKLADCANDDGIAWPSQARLRDECGVGDRALRSSLKALAAKGLLKIERRGLTKTNVYRIISRPAEMQDQETAPMAQHEPSEDLTVGSSTDVELPPFAAAPQKQNGHRPRNHVWDALTEYFGEPSNDNEVGQRAKAVKLIKQSLGERADDREVVRDEIALRLAMAQNWEVKTPLGIANQWTALGQEARSSV